MNRRTKPDPGHDTLSDGTSLRPAKRRKAKRGGKGK